MRSHFYKVKHSQTVIIALGLLNRAVSFMHHTLLLGIALKPVRAHPCPARKA